MILAAAADANHEFGWGSVTMVALAKRIGISRQTLYNEVGSKANLARMVAEDSSDQMVRLLDEAFAESPEDIHAGVRRAVDALLANWPASPVDPPQLVADVVGALRSSLDRHELDLSAEERDSISRALVRLVYSAATQPESWPPNAAQEISWISSRLLRRTGTY